jgi:hypothetical protein
MYRKYEGLGETNVMNQPNIPGSASQSRYMELSSFLQSPRSRSASQKQKIQRPWPNKCNVQEVHHHPDIWSTVVFSNFPGATQQLNQNQTNEICNEPTK